MLHSFEQNFNDLSLFLIPRHLTIYCASDANAIFFVSQYKTNQSCPFLLQTFDSMSQHYWSTCAADFDSGVGDNDFKEISRLFEIMIAATNKPGR